jgi:succinate dehydrogenase / fumarate reductase flavoprotein subunit
MQQKIVSLQQDDAKKLGTGAPAHEGHLKVFAELTITELIKDGSGAIAGAFGYYRETGEFVLFKAPAVVLATGGIGKVAKVTSNSWECTGDGMGLALRSGANLINMEFVQFHPTGMVWPPSVKGILVTESVRGDGGVLRNSDGQRFMFDYVPDVFRAQYAETEEEADRWYTDPDNNRRPPELLPRDEVARSINSEIKAGRGSPHGGVFLDIASRRSADYILKRLPSMHHQFKELADVDITKEPMEIGPTCHYVMGGVEVAPDTAATNITGLFASGEVAGGMHGSNRLGGNSLSDLLVFGKRSGEGAVAYVKSLGGQYPTIPDAFVADCAQIALAPLENSGESAYELHDELQQCINDLVGLIRVANELQDALDRIEKLKERAKHVSAVGGRPFNPGWHLALDLRNMLAVAECMARAALTREESRGGHTRDDYPGMNPEWRKINLICALNTTGDGIAITRKPVPTMRSDLLDLFQKDELKKYYTDEEIAGVTEKVAAK